MIGQQEDIERRPPRTIGNFRHHPRQLGRLEAWKELAGICQHSRVLTLALCAAFAAPLLKGAGLQPFGLNIFGRSRSGKSTAGLAAASTFGIGEESRLPNWDVTPSGLQELARNFNDHALVLNELAVIRAGTKREAYEAVRRAIYAFAEGTEATRHSGSAFTATAQAATWRGIFLSTSEISISDLAREGQRVRDDGEFARCIDVPAVVGRRTTIIDAWPEGEQSKRQFSQNCLVRIREVCRDHHGVAFPVYIEHLLEKTLAVAASETLEAIREFEKEVGSATGPLGHAVKNFGLIYAGGLQAIESELLPLSREALLRKIKQCFEDAVDIMPLREAVERRAVKMLKKAIRKTTWRSASMPHAQRALSGESTLRTTVRQRKVLLAGLEVFDSWFGGDSELRNYALLWLRSKGLLRLQKNKKLAVAPFNREDYTKYWKIRGKNWRFVQFHWPPS